MKATTSRRTFATALGAAGALAALGGRNPAAAANDLIVTSYAGRYERFWRDKLLPEFKAKTGVDSIVDAAANGTTWATNLRTTGPAKPNYSMVMLNEIVGAMLRNEGYFEPWPADKVPNLKFVHPKAKNPDNNGVAFMISPVGIAYRTDLVKEPMSSWKDLWRPALRGKVGLFSIGNSAGYMFLMTMSQIYGSGPLDFDAGLRMVEQLKPFPQGDLAGALSTLLTRGEIIACPLDTSEVINLRQKGAPIGFVVPQEGMFAFDQTLNLLAHGPNKDAACKYLDFLLSEDVQQKLVEEFFYVPTNVNVKLPASLAKQFPITIDDVDKLLKFDWVAANGQRDKAIESWNRLTR